MTTVECQRCGSPFDTDHDGAAKHADTRRCPSCGDAHTDAEVEVHAVSRATDGGTTGASAVEITLTIEIHGVDAPGDVDLSID